MSKFQYFICKSLDLIICENANALKDLKEYQVSIETLVNEQKQRRNLSQQQPQYSLDRRSADTIRTRTRLAKNIFTF